MPRNLPSRPQPSAGQVKEAARLFSEARHPLLILGGGAAEAGPQAQAIAEVTGAIVLTTTAGKGVIPASHPLCLGARMAQAPMKKLMQEADVILAVGTEISETDLWEASIELPGKIIRIDLDPEVLMRPHASQLAILADAALALDAVAQALPSRDTRKSAPTTKLVWQVILAGSLKGRTNHEPFCARFSAAFVRPCPAIPSLPRI